MNWYDYYFPQEMMEQADAIENCLNLLEEQIELIAQKSKNVKEVHIVGSGDCYFIGFAAAHAFKKYSGISATGYEAYDYFLLKPKVDEDTLVVLFSSSGRSLYVLKSLEYVKQQNGISVGVTNHEESELGKDSSIPLITVATGVSKSFPTKTTTSGLALMYALACKLGVIKGYISSEDAVEFMTELKVAVPDVIRRIYETEYPKIKDNIQKFLGSKCYAFIGSGPSRSASMVGAAKIIETNHCHIMTTNAEEYLHMNGFCIMSSDSVIVIGSNLTDHREAQAVEYAEQQCARVLVVGNVQCEEKENTVKVAPFISELSPFAAVLASMVVLHLFACELARLSNTDPDVPRHVNLKHVIGLLYTGPVAGWQV
ncbi:MAG: SIS domain-containing protein [Ruminococcaceae bacterium]|nr:SIS domain-containing protein [Oscillospiraceae bacterium]